MSNQSRRSCGFMKILFAITIILTVFSSLSVWFILNDVFKKKLQETSENHQVDLLELINTNTELKNKILTLKDETIVREKASKEIKMVEIESRDKEAKRMKSEKDDKEKPLSIEDKNLPDNPVFKLSDLGPLLMFKNVKSLENPVSENFSKDKLKGKALILNDGLVDFVNKSKDEIIKNENYKIVYAKKWVSDIKVQMGKDKKHVFDQLDISDIKNNDINMDGLKNLLLETDVNKIKYNSYFAFEYFKRPDLETKIRSQQNWPGLTPLSETDKKKPDKREKWEKDVKAKKDEYFVYLNKYQEFLKKLNSDDSDPKKDMATIEEIKNYFLKNYKAFLEYKKIK